MDQYRKEYKANKLYCLLQDWERCQKQQKNNIYMALSCIYRSIGNELSRISSMDDIEKFGGLHRLESKLENLLEVIRNGTPTEKEMAFIEARDWM